MAEDTEGGDARDTEVDPAAIAVALGRPLDPRAAAYLEEQTRLTRRRIEESDREDHIRHWSLRVRHIGDVLKLAFELGIAVLVLIVVLAAGATLWNASHANGLVVDSFTAPPDFAAQGIGGDTIAFDLTNRLAHIRNFAVSQSLSGSGDVSGSGGDDIKVDIPDTGVSLGAVWRYLREWLGHERHVHGSLRQLPDGTISLSAALAGEDAVEESGRPADLGKIESDVAERIFARFDPVNDTIYLWSSGRYADALQRARDFALSDQWPEWHADSYALWGETTSTIAGDVPLAIAREKTAIAIDPRLAIAHLDLAERQALLGHDEIALAEYRATLDQSEQDQPRLLQGPGFLAVRREARENIASLAGDYSLAESIACGSALSCVTADMGGQAIYAALLHDIAKTRTLIDAARAIDRTDAFEQNRARYEAAAGLGNWSEAAGIAQLRSRVFAQANRDAGPGRVAATDMTDSRPRLARALAHIGAFAQADAAIAPTQADCYECVRARGEIETQRRNWNAAAWWFDDAVRQAPSIPFAYADWGAMLLQAGRYDAAIAKFTLANQKGPHFADPLEMWGEALIRKNRSDLALAKFAEADKYAPDWGRLHLKWGEALLWAGNSADAKKQFAVAADHDLTPLEKSELGRVMHV